MTAANAPASSWESFRARKLREFASGVKARKVDNGIRRLVGLINHHADLVASSSCSGRVQVLEIGAGESSAKTLHKWHDFLPPDVFLHAVNGYSGRKWLWAQAEPFVLHVFARDDSATDHLLAHYRRVGLKHYGLKKFEPFPFIEATGNPGFSLPIFEKRPLVSHEYLAHLVRVGNDQLLHNRKSIAKLEKELSMPNAVSAHT